MNEKELELLLDLLVKIYQSMQPFDTGNLSVNGVYGMVYARIQEIGIDKDKAFYADYVKKHYENKDIDYFQTIVDIFVETLKAYYYKDDQNLNKTYFQAEEFITWAKEEGEWASRWNNQNREERLFQSEMLALEGEM